MKPDHENKSMNFQNNKDIETLAKAGQRQYMREYRKRNKAKIKEINQRYYAKIALQQTQEG